MAIKKRIIGKLKENQFDLFLRQSMCKKATDDLIRSIVHEREKAEVYLHRIWEKIYKEYCNNLSPDELNKVELDLKTGEVILYEDTTGEELSEESLDLRKLDLAWCKE